MLLFNLYISIVNRKISCPVVVLNFFFLTNFKEMYYHNLTLLIEVVEVPL